MAPYSSLFWTIGSPYRGERNETEAKHSKRREGSLRKTNGPIGALSSMRCAIPRESVEICLLLAPNHRPGQERRSIDCKFGSISCGLQAYTTAVVEIHSLRSRNGARPDCVALVQASRACKSYARAGKAPLQKFANTVAAKLQNHKMRLKLDNAKQA